MEIELDWDGMADDLMSAQGIKEMTADTPEQAEVQTEVFRIQRQAFRQN